MSYQMANCHAALMDMMSNSVGNTVATSLASAGGGGSSSNECTPVNLVLESVGIGMGAVSDPGCTTLTMQVGAKRENIVECPGRRGRKLSTTNLSLNQESEDINLEMMIKVI